MDRWVLLYDGACPKCGQLARLIVHYSAGRLQLQSLRDEHLREELALPPVTEVARWEPLLVKVGSGRRTVYRGLLLRVHLTRLVGVVGVVRVLQGIRVATTVSPLSGVTRRAVLLRAVAVTGAVLGFDNLSILLADARAGPETDPLSGAALVTARHSQVALEAAQNFGTIDWASARVLRAKDGQIDGYAVRIGKTSVLIVVYPTAHRQGVSAVFTVGRRQDDAELDWFTPQGERIVLTDDPPYGLSPGPIPDTCQIIPCGPKKGPKAYIACLNECISRSCTDALVCCLTGDRAVCCPVLAVCVAVCHATCRALLF